MSNNSFTYTITSRESTLGANQANNVKINVSGFPTQYKYFKCKVLNFNYNFMTLTDVWRNTKLFYLVSDNLVAGDRPTSSNKGFDIIANMTGLGGLNNNVGNEFIIANPNEKTLNFQLVDQTFANIVGNINMNGEGTVWILSLLITPIEDNPNNYQLRHGL